jgi:hypothetical protein
LDFRQYLSTVRAKVADTDVLGIPKEKICRRPLQLHKRIVKIEVFELFMPKKTQNITQDELENEKMKRFAKDLTLALNSSTAEVNSLLENTVAKVCKEYLC